MNLSIVVPVYNEEENITELCSEVKEKLPKNLTYELIFVDDGSTDESWREIKKAKKNFNFVKGIRFRRNYGQTQAMAAGISDALGEYIAAMDADMQNDPGDIKFMLEEIEKGYDLVSGWRKNRKDDYWLRILPSAAANKLISWVTGIKLHDYGCTLKIYRREIIKEIELYGEMHRFLPALAGYKGASISEIEVNHRPRKAGKSKYGIFRTFKVAADLLTVKFMGDFMTKPGYFFSFVSLCLFSVSFLFALITLYYKWYNGIFVKDQPLFLVAIFLAIVGVQTGLMGLLAEMTMRVYISSSGKPSYRIKERA
ncbi:MAG: glycosyltransferase family 2 protein [Elusimicrobia bacterium]|nr:glycosyltransferase family 2 protein [Elusimicrobiota bacterium]